MSNCTTSIARPAVPEMERPGQLFFEGLSLMALAVKASVTVRVNRWMQARELKAEREALLLLSDWVLDDIGINTADLMTNRAWAAKKRELNR